MSTSPSIDDGALRAQIKGGVVTREDPVWDDARQAWNLVADQRPSLVVRPTNGDDVAATVRFAAASGLRVAPQCFGHGAVSLGDLDGTILLRTIGMTGVSIDPERRTASVRAGAAWRDVIGPAAEHGLVGLHGMAGGVGVIGYALGGGIGWLSRLHGLASTHINSLEVVTADGEQRHVDADNEPELFWALRGGGGGPAVVTSMEIALFELREAFAGALMWPLDAAGEIVHAFREWTPTAPDEVTPTLRLLRFPPLPSSPTRCAAASWSRSCSPSAAASPTATSWSRRCARSARRIWTRSRRSRRRRWATSPEILRTPVRRSATACCSKNSVARPLTRISSWAVRARRLRSCRWRSASSAGR